MNPDENPRVSLMMLSYNSEKFIQAAVSSVVNQTYRNWELVISDDASTDGTWELVRRMASVEPRIRHFRNKANLGTPRNRAEASKHLTGDLIAHFDSDDVLYPDAVRLMVNAFAAKPDADLIYSDYSSMDAAGNIDGYVANPNPTSDLSGFGWKPFGMFRRSSFDRTEGYNTRINHCEDGDIFMQLVEHGKFYRIPHVLYARRSHADNVSRKNKHCRDCGERQVCNFMRVWSKHANYDPVTFTPLKK